MNSVLRLGRSLKPFAYHGSHRKIRSIFCLGRKPPFAAGISFLTAFSQWLSIESEHRDTISHIRRLKHQNYLLVLCRKLSWSDLIKSFFLIQISIMWFSFEYRKISKTLEPSTYHDIRDRIFTYSAVYVPGCLACNMT